MGNQSVLKGSAFFEKYIRKNFIKYILILFIYLLGFIIGIGVFNNNITKEGQSVQISQYISNSINQIDGNEDVWAEYVKQDFFELIILLVLSFSVIGVPLIILLVFIKAISLGITISALIFTGGAGMGMAFSILMFMIPIIIKIFTTLIVVSSSIKFMENILMYKKEFKYELIRHSCVNIIAFVMTCINLLYRVISFNILNQILF